jgi:cytochrome c heme-lyase
VCTQAFEVVTRPALDTLDSALDRLKMNIYVNFAKWGLPCPVTGVDGALGKGMLQQQQQPAPAAAQGSS